MFAATAAAAQDRPVAYARQVTASYAFDLAPAPDEKQAVLIRVISGREQLFLRHMDTGAERQISFDDADHEVLGLQDDRFQVIYHYAVGMALEDRRILTLPAYE